MDEKRFDVDGTYNARYEVVKKRIDKANIKGRKELLKRENHHCVFPQLRRNRIPKVYQVLQFKGILEPTIEQFDVEELQGVSGLKAIRIKVSNIVDSNCHHKSYTYQELLDELD
jgi:hypothetical protein